MSDFCLQFLASELLELKVEVLDTLNPLKKVKFIYTEIEIINYVVAPYFFYDTCIAVGIEL